MTKLDQIRQITDELQDLVMRWHERKLPAWMILQRLESEVYTMETIKNNGEKTMPETPKRRRRARANRPEEVLAACLERLNALPLTELEKVLRAIRSYYGSMLDDGILPEKKPSDDDVLR